MHLHKYLNERVSSSFPVLYKETQIALLKMKNLFSSRGSINIYDLNGWTNLLDNNDNIVSSS